MTGLSLARVKGMLNHPVIDADGHWLEVQPVFLDYLKDIAGPELAHRYAAEGAGGNLHSRGWYNLSQVERSKRRVTRPGWWSYPSDTETRAAGILPSIYRQRLDDWGIDFALVYPTMGLVLPNAPDLDMRRALVRAYNVMVADLFSPYADRMTPAGICALNTPAEAIEEAEYAVKILGLKVLVMNCTVPRTIESADGLADPAMRRIYIDCLAMDSLYDYDAVWRKMVDLKVAVTDHTVSSGWPDRSSPTSYVANHLGHFAQAHHAFARGLFLGGVTERFPGLTFGFLEGGVGWGYNLYTDLQGHWKKRNKAYMHRHLKPENIDRQELRRLLEKNSVGTRFHDKIDEIVDRNLYALSPNLSQEALTARDIDSDEFANVNIGGQEDFHRLVLRTFYFGCEADDPVTAWAFDSRGEAPLKAMLGSDISHFDVTDPAEVLPEAWEMVDRGLITEDDFRAFTFGNVAELHTRMNPDFFRGTAVESDIAAELGQKGQGGRSA